MPSGGARPGAGRRQDPNALDTSRRKDSSGLIVISAAERTEPAPDWPFPEVSEGELAMWARYWRKPQAQYWLDHSMVEIVALFVRQFCESATPKNSAENRKAVQSFLSQLGLTAPALKAAGYAIGEVKPEAAKPKRQSRASAASGLKVINGGQGA